MSIVGFDEFELDIELAFRRDLPPFIDGVPSAALVESNIMSIPCKKNGVYILLEGEDVRYVGKTDARAGFQQRLLRHLSHIQHRCGLQASIVRFKAISIPVFKNADVEDMLIAHYGARWNNSGFGSNDPQERRGRFFVFPSNSMP